MLGLAAAGLSLERLDPDERWGVVRYEASVSAAVHVVFLAEIVLIEQADPHARNADKKPRCRLTLNRALSQCPMASTVFQLGSRPGT